MATTTWKTPQPPSVRWTALTPAKLMLRRISDSLPTAVMAGELAEGSFFLFFIRLEKTFEHELGVRRHLQRHGFAVYDLERLAANRARHRQLVDTERKRTGSRHHQARIDADRNRNRKG